MCMDCTCRCIMLPQLFGYMTLPIATGIVCYVAYYCTGCSIKFGMSEHRFKKLIAADQQLVWVLVRAYQNVMWICWDVNHCGVLTIVASYSLTAWSEPDHSMLFVWVLVRALCSLTITWPLHAVGLSLGQSLPNVMWICWDVMWICWYVIATSGSNYKHLVFGSIWLLQSSWMRLSSQSLSRACPESWHRTWSKAYLGAKLISTSKAATNTLLVLLMAKSGVAGRCCHFPLMVLSLLHIQ